MTATLKRALALAVALAGLTSALAFASESDEPEPSHTPELIKLYKSKALGAELRLPGLWIVSDVPDGVRAVEPDQPRPAALELGAVPLPEALPAETLAEALVVELQRSLTDLQVRRREPIQATDPNEDRFYLELRATEEKQPVRYALLVVTARRRAFIASLSAPDERFASFAPRALLTAVVDSID